MYITPHEYIEIIRKEYLQEFIRHGGTAVKFIVPTEEIDHKNYSDNCAVCLNLKGYLFAAIDAAQTKVHMIDHIFHEVARQIEWDDLAFSLSHAFCPLTDSKSQPWNELNIRKLAELNELDETLLRVDFKKTPCKESLSRLPDVSGISYCNDAIVPGST